MQDFRELDRQVWHQRYLAQSGWTQHIREYVFSKISPLPDEPILEVGSGTGAVLTGLLQKNAFKLVGVDIDFPSLSFASSLQIPFHPIQADGQQLPFRAHSFGVTLCHYLLMWVDNPKQILYEMRRVTYAGGWVLALAEPDHQARVDYPPPLDELGHKQTQALISQGVDVSIGRKLRSLFHQTGFLDVEVGILAAQWKNTNSAASDETEWTMIQADLKSQLSKDELAHYQHIDQQAQNQGARILFIPTFYAIGKVP